MSKEKSGATIYYHDIGDYLSREQKLGIIRKARSINGVEWTELHPDEHGDWINHRNGKFAEFIPLGDKDDKKNAQTVFAPWYCRGLETARDPWCYNFSKSSLRKNIEKTISFFNEQRNLFVDRKDKSVTAKDFVKWDPLQISWSRAFLAEVTAEKMKAFDEASLVTAVYRPFCKQNCYFNRQLNNVVSSMDSFFPTYDAENLIICVSGVGGTKNFTAIMTDQVPDVQLQFNGQCFPLYWYEKAEGNQLSAFDNDSGYIRHDGITDWMLKDVRSRFANTRAITKEHIFYYVYGLLHSPEYRETFSADLKKELPRIPIVESIDDFMDFSKAGRALAELHLHYDDFAAESAASANRNSAASYALVADKRIKYDASQPGARAPQIFFDGLVTPVDNIPEAALRIDKMRFATKEDKSQIIY
ncbi:MAG: hypothetical protein M0P13_12055, partial [Fibrobacteraceae bacterium]|nr:hypothetical protein [Fibrobacteraceae bacterium]